MDPLPGQLNLNEQIAPQVPAGSPRPFAPGEWVQNPDGSWSSEITVTVTDPRLNNGQPTVVPSLWLVDGKPVRVNEDAAVDMALKSGLAFQGFPDMAAAEKFANDRESAWQGIKPAEAVKIPPLWKAQPKPIAPEAQRALNQPHPARAAIGAQ